MSEKILFLPGLLCDARLWRDQVAAFPGSVVADLTQDSAMDDMAARALGGIEGRFSLVGLSMGGYVAQAIMRMAPQRVVRLGLFDTSARADPPEQAKRRRALMGIVRNHQFRGVTPKLLPSLLHKSRLSDESLCKAVLEMAERVGRDAFLRQQQAILTRIDSRPYLAQIACPTIVAYGEADITTPPELSEEIAALIPGATLHRIANAGHLPSIEVPNDVNDILRNWLAIG
jgi:pimeloyl-ACP methyl ester carboxylesterase